MKIEELKSASKSLGIELTESMCQQFSTYASVLKQWNEKMNLTAITEEEEVIEKHFFDCLIALSAVDSGNRIADVGSGAGFPGLVFKIARPDCEVTLIEPTEKRCTFLRAVIEELKLEKVEVVNARAEDYCADHRESFDLVTARAVAALPVLAELCIPLVKVGGTFLAMKGSKGLEEAEQAKKAIQVLGCVKKEFDQDSLQMGDTRINLVYTKKKATPPQYPRPYAKIHKKPLQ